MQCKLCSADKLAAAGADVPQVVQLLHGVTVDTKVERVVRAPPPSTHHTHQPV